MPNYALRHVMKLSVDSEWYLKVFSGKQFIQETEQNNSEDALTSNFDFIVYHFTKSGRKDKYLYFCKNEDCCHVERGLKKFFNHIRYHSKEKPFICEFPGCGQAFSQLSNRNSHQTLHSEDKRFACNLCGKNFHKKFNLQTHLKSHEKKQKSK